MQVFRTSGQHNKCRSITVNFEGFHQLLGYHGLPTKFGNLPGGHERDQHTSFSLQAKDEMLQRPQPWLNTSRLSFMDLQKML